MYMREKIDYAKYVGTFFWDRTMNLCFILNFFSSFWDNLCFFLCDFLGDITQRMCTEAEIQAYGQSFASGKSGTRSSFLKPNINCNLSSWVNGCEPGWGCKANQKVDIGSHKKGIPIRSVDCQPCCEGFFCPHGLTCMIRKYYLCTYKNNHNTN